MKNQLISRCAEPSLGGMQGVCAMLALLSVIGLVTAQSSQSTALSSSLANRLADMSPRGLQFNGNAHLSLPGYSGFPSKSWSIMMTIKCDQPAASEFRPHSVI